MITDRVQGEAEAWHRKYNGEGGLRMNEQSIEILLQCILDILIELEYADDNQIDADFCVRTMEIAASVLHKISHSDIGKITDIINKIKENEKDGVRCAFIEDFMNNFLAE